MTAQHFALALLCTVLLGAGLIVVGAALLWSPTVGVLVAGVLLLALGVTALMTVDVGRVSVRRGDEE